MKQLFALFFLCFSLFIFGQNDPRDPFFRAINTRPGADEKVHHENSDSLGVNPKLYGGNQYFKGNVKFSHAGSDLSADLVIHYKDENFVKAIGNVRLQNPDGTQITSNEMEYDGNTQRGIARGNVVMTDPKQTIRTDILYYDRLANKAYFNTGGTISSPGNTMYTKSATYDVATKMIDFTGRVRFDNAEYTLEGDNIVQNQITNVATFTGPTTIRNKQNPANQVYTEFGTYNQNTKEVFLNRNSRINYNGKILTGDKLYFNQITGFGKGNGNVLLRDPAEKRFVKGDYGEIYEKKDSAMLSGHAYAVKALEKDSMYFGAEKIITFQQPSPEIPGKKLSFIRAFYQSRFYKSNAQARADSLSFNETDGILHLNTKPFLWSGPRQVTGDKIEAYFDTEKEQIDSLKVINNAFAIAKADSTNLKDEFNQVKGKLMSVYYGEKNEIKNVRVFGNAQAITYADEISAAGVKNRIGVALTSCGVIDVLFEEQKVQVIECNVGASSDTYPMSKISTKQRFLPDFNWNTKDRPLRWEDILVDTPNNPPVEYITDNPYFDMANAASEKAKAEEEAKKPKRARK